MEEVILQPCTLSMYASTPDKAPGSACMMSGANSKLGRIWLEAGSCCNELTCISRWVQALHKVHICGGTTFFCNAPICQAQVPAVTSSLSKACCNAMHQSTTTASRARRRSTAEPLILLRAVQRILSFRCKTAIRAHDDGIGLPRHCRHNTDLWPAMTPTLIEARGERSPLSIVPRPEVLLQHTLPVLVFGQSRYWPSAMLTLLRSLRSTPWAPNGLASQQRFLFSAGSPSSQEVAGLNQVSPDGMTVHGASHQPSGLLFRSWTSSLECTTHSSRPISSRTLTHQHGLAQAVMAAC